MGNVAPSAEARSVPRQDTHRSRCSSTEAHHATSDRSIVRYAWDLGDGTTAGGQRPSHTYASRGSYFVKLTVLDDDGDRDTL